MKKIIISGSNGFLGNNILNYFSAKYPDSKVVGLTRQTCDIASAQAITSYLSEELPDVVIHSAVKIDDLANNIKMHHALESASGFVGKIVTLGSGAEYNPKNYKPLMEENYFNNSIPEDPYSLSKYLISRMIDSGPANISNLRLFGIFGIGEDYSRRFISNNIVRHILGLQMQMNKDISFDYFYVPDFLESLNTYLLKENLHKHYNLCTGDPIKFSTILQKICSVVGLPNDQFIILDKTETDYQYSGNPSRFIEEFGPIRKTPLDESAYELYNYYLGMKHALKLPAAE